MNQIKLGLVFALIQKWGYQAINFLVFVILARNIDPEEFGFVLTILAFIYFVMIFVEGGISEALIHNTKNTQKEKNAVFTINILLSIILSIATIIFSHYIDNITLSNIIRVLSLLLVITGMTNVQATLIKKELNFKLLALASLFGVVIAGIISITLIYAGMGIWALVAFFVSNKLSESLFIWIKSSENLSISTDFQRLSGILHYGKDITISNVFNYMNKYSADIILAITAGPAAVAYFNIAFKLVRLVLDLTVSVFSHVFFPVLSSFKTDKTKCTKIFLVSTELAAVLSMPIFISIALLAPNWVPIVFGSSWEKAIPVVVILSFIGYLQALSFMNYPLLMALGKSKEVLYLRASNAIMNVSVIYILSYISVAAAALGFTIRGYLLTPMQLFYIKKSISISYINYLKLLTRPVLSGCITVTLFFIIGSQKIAQDSNIFVVVMSALVIFLVYISFYYILFRKNLTKLIGSINE